MSLHLDRKQRQIFVGMQIPSWTLFTGLFFQGLFLHPICGADWTSLLSGFSSSRGNAGLREYDFPLQTGLSWSHVDSNPSLSDCQLHCIFWDVFCKITRTVYCVSYYSNISFVTCQSVDHYLALMQPLKSLRVSNSSGFWLAFLYGQWLPRPVCQSPPLSVLRRVQTPPLVVAST